jgi:ABC-type branched-subunit amino acid transport system ATPase component/ABC-type branched-subunit amino acid transport system permease subunit
MVTIPFPGVDFQIPYNVLILGLITGLTYAVLGMGIALVYRTSRVLNFAQGEMGALPAFLIPILVLNRHWNYWVTLIMALAGAVFVGGLTEFLIIRRLRHASRLTVLVATIALAQVLYIIGVLIPKGSSDLIGQSYPTPFSTSVTIGSLVLGPGQLMILIVVPATMVGLTLFLRRSRLGRASRAAAENAEAAQLAGIPTNRISFAMWAITGLLAGVSAILIAPTEPISVGVALGPTLLVRALGAAMLGGLTRLPMVFLGGIGIGVVEALVTWNYPNGDATDLVIFAIILISLLLQRRLGQQARGMEASSWALARNLRPLPPDLAANPRVRRARPVVFAVLLAIAIVLPLPLHTAQRFFLGEVAVFAIMGLSLVVLTGYAGQVSLGQLAFVGVGAAVGGRLLQLGLPAPAAALIATVIGGILALVIGLPALRIRGLFLAVTTLAFSVAVAGWLFTQGWLVKDTGFVNTLQIPPEKLGPINLQDQQTYYWLCLAVLVVLGAAVARLRTSRLGRAMIAVRDNEASAASLSISPGQTKLAAFVISGMIAAFAGYLYGGLLVNFSYDPSSTFGAQGSLDLVVLTVLGGVTTVTGAILGALWVEGLPELFGQNVGLLSSGFGLIAILLVLPGGLASLVFTLRDRAAAWLAAGSSEPAVEAVTSPAVPHRTSAIARRPAVSPETAPDGSIPLRAEGVRVRYGGLIALDDVSIHARRSEIVGIMGTNGAGKTTLFDVLSGRIRPVGGAVHLHGRDITNQSSHGRARLGLGRTFQQARLFDDLTVLDTVQIAVDGRGQRGVDVSSHNGNGGGHPLDRGREAASATLHMIGLHEHRHRYAGELSTGTRRLVELACVAALGADVLLLDEPTAGFTPAEVDEFVEVLRNLRDTTGVTLVVIDHDVPMMTDLAERLYVLEAGRVIAEGSSAILSDNPRVVAAYLGGVAAE